MGTCEQYAGLKTHHAMITNESMHDNEGTTFTVRDALAFSLISILIVLFCTFVFFFFFFFFSPSSSSLLHVQPLLLLLKPHFVMLHYTQKQASCTISLQFFSIVL
jgi:hypothetical protein